MKKVFAILTAAVIMTSCNDTTTTNAAETDSARAAATADSIEKAANQAMADSAKVMMDTPATTKDSAQSK